MSALRYSRPDDVLVCLDAPHFCCAILVDREERIVVQAAPIVGWTIGRSWDVVRGIFKRRGVKIVVMNPTGPR